MTRTLLSWIAVSTILATTAVRAGGTVADPKGEAEIHAVKAKAFADQKSWQEARDEAEQATIFDPARADAWLLLGASEQRLDHRAAALKAYRTYLNLNPPEEKASAVRTRIGELEVESETAGKKDDEEARTRYGNEAAGLWLGYSPVYKPKAATDRADLLSGTSSSFDAAFGTGWLLIGMRFAKGTTGPLNFQSSEVVTNIVTNIADKPTVTNTAVSGLSVLLLEPYIQLSIPVNRVYGSWGGFQGFIPLYLGVPINRVTGPASTFENFGLDVGGGLGVRWYSKSPFVASLQALYHSVPLAGDISNREGTIGNTAITNVLQTSDGAANVKGIATGFELRFGVAFIFPMPKADGAEDTILKSTLLK